MRHAKHLKAFVLLYVQAYLHVNLNKGADLCSFRLGIFSDGSTESKEQAMFIIQGSKPQHL
ncbi:MAG TPA: hypothetical protein DCZ95_16135 [Verrucomicrobia bacterium]|nr:hypothetical protein [Verrucomicrobiota bacterium]